MGYSHNFTYDYAGKLVAMSAPGTVSDSYLYDADDNLRRHEVTNSLGGISLDSLVYDARGKITIATSSNFGSATITTMYDGLGAVIDEHTESTVEGSTEEMFVVDGLGNRVRRRQLLNDDGGGSDFQHQRLFDYDAFGKLTQMTTPTGLANNFMHTEDYSYDPAGNTTLVHILESQSGSTPDHVSHISYYSADNKLRVFNKRIGVGSASNDAAAGKRGTFDEYRYDALGRRVFARSRKLGGNCPTAQVDCAPTATRTVWDGDHILYEIRAAGRDTVVGTDTIPAPAMESDNPNGGPNGLAYGVVGYTYGLNIDEPITITRMGSTHYGIYDPTLVFPHTGWRGMLALATDTAGRRIDCPISGNICIPIDLPGGNATVDRGKKVEAEPLSWFGSLALSGAEQSGLQYKRNRFFDPKRGQFTQVDPIGLGGGLNLYGFASGDAVNFDDPFGLCTFGKDCWKAFVKGVKSFWNDPSTQNTLLIGSILFAESSMDPDGAGIDAEMQGAILESRAGKVDELLSTAAELQSGELTAAGRALEKPGSRPGSAFPRAVGNSASKNATGLSIVEEILTSPGSRRVDLTKGRFSGGFDVYSADGRGVRFDSKGKFVTFLEPRK